MSVLMCDKRECDNIMSDYYSNKYGYLCNECFNELRFSKLPIDIFMNTTPNRDYRETDRLGELIEEFENRYDRED